jgi:hypothetical protein
MTTAPIMINPSSSNAALGQGRLPAVVAVIAKVAAVLTAEMSASARIPPLRSSQDNLRCAG